MLKLMTILRNSLVLILFFISCKENKKGESMSNDLNIVFRDTLSKIKLYDFKFGVFYENEELPIDFILNRESSLVNKKINSVLISNIKNKKENLYGYFSKKGYKTKKFLIDKSSNYQSVIIVPEDTTISIKAFDKEVCNDIDSISVRFEIKENNLITKEYYKFNRNDATSYLEYFSKNISLGQSIDVEIKVYKNNEVYKINKHIEYQPLLHTSIILI
jgi:hypothetical protein